MLYPEPVVWEDRTSFSHRHCFGITLLFELTIEQPVRVLLLVPSYRLHSLFAIPTEVSGNLRPPSRWMDHSPKLSAHRHSKEPGTFEDSTTAIHRPYKVRRSA
jgi:hypothetical protein